MLNGHFITNWLKTNASLTNISATNTHCNSYMQKESDFLNPYEVVTDDQDRYWFITESGVCYSATFAKSHGYFCHYPQFDHQVVTFSFKPYEVEDQVLLKAFKKAPAIPAKPESGTQLSGYSLNPSGYIRKKPLYSSANPAMNLLRAGNGYSTDVPTSRSTCAACYLQI